MGGGVSKWKWQDTKSIFGKARNSWDSDSDSDSDLDSDLDNSNELKMATKGNKIQVTRIFSLPLSLSLSLYLSTCTL